MSPFYWKRHSDGPFVTLIAVVTTYLDPENYHLDSLKELADARTTRRCECSSPSSVSPKDSGQLPGDEFFESVEYDDGSDEAFLLWLWHELYGDEPLRAPGLFHPDLEFRELDTRELVAMVPRTSESVLRRGQALIELGRRSAGDTTLLRQVADIIRDPENRRLITVGTASVSQLGTAGLIAGAAALARELAAEWTTGERSDFAWLMRSSGIPWPQQA